MEEKDSYLLITRFLSKQTSTEENELLADWISASAANEQIFEEVKTLWLVRKPDSQAAAAFLKLKAQIHAEEQTSRYSFFTKWYIPGIAASIVTLLIAGTVFYKKYSSVTYLEQRTAAGQKKTVKLEDGTVVYLAPQSILRYPSSLAPQERIVELSGEAYFEVSKNPHRPFIVHTDKLDVEVLGTHFNVRSYKTIKSTTVSLLEGKVKVNVSDDKLDAYFLDPGQELVVDHLSNAVYRHSLDSTSAIGWMKNILVFKNQKLIDAAAKIEQTYGVKMVFADQRTADLRIYASFRNETLINVLKTIEATGNVAYHIEGNKVYLTLNN